MNDVPNGELRQHVTSGAFLLTLGKSHITALVLLDYGIRHRTRGLPAEFSYFVPAVRGLRERGLVDHHPQDMRGRRARDYVGRHWSLTKAGRLVRDLLKEAGIWQEYATGLGLDALEEAAS